MRPTSTRRGKGAGHRDPDGRRQVATRRATATRPAPTATRVAYSVSPPALLSPANGAAVQGVVTFRWQPTGPLEAGVKYEVVWWNVNESPERRAGIRAAVHTDQPERDLAPCRPRSPAGSSTGRWSS